MLSKAQKNAIARYRAKAARSVSVSFYPPDWDIYEFLSIQGNKAGYIKQVLREKMNEAISTGSYTPNQSNSDV